MTLLSSYQSHSSPQKAAAKATKDRLLSCLHMASSFYARQLLISSGKPAIAYIQSRKISASTAFQFKLGYAPYSSLLLKNLTAEGFTEKEIMNAGLILESMRPIEKIERSSSSSPSYFDRFQHRLMVPIQDTAGDIVGFGGRILDNNNNSSATRISNYVAPKYLNSPQTILFKKSSLLFGFFQARLSVLQTKMSIVVEGYLDVISLHDIGKTNAVGVLGSSLTPEQFQLLLKLGESHSQHTILLLFDEDEAGMRAIDKLCSNLLPSLLPSSSSVSVKVASLRDASGAVLAKDPSAICGLYSKAEALSIMEGILSRAIDWKQWKVVAILTDFGITLSSSSSSVDMSIISQAVKAVVKFLALLPSPSDRTLLAHFVAEKLSFGKSLLQHQLEIDMLRMIETAANSATATVGTVEIETTETTQPIKRAVQPLASSTLNRSPRDQISSADSSTSSSSFCPSPSPTDFVALSSSDNGLLATESHLVYASSLSSASKILPSRRAESRNSHNPTSLVKPPSYANYSTKDDLLYLNEEDKVPESFEIFLSPEDNPVLALEVDLFGATGRKKNKKTVETGVWNEEEEGDLQRLMLESNAGRVLHAEILLLSSYFFMPSLRESIQDTVSGAADLMNAGWRWMNPVLGNLWTLSTSMLTEEPDIDPDVWLDGVWDHLTEEERRKEEVIQVFGGAEIRDKDESALVFAVQHAISLLQDMKRKDDKLKKLNRMRDSLETMTVISADEDIGGYEQEEFSRELQSGEILYQKMADSNALSRRMDMSFSLDFGNVPASLKSALFTADGSVVTGLQDEGDTEEGDGNYDPSTFDMEMISPSARQAIERVKRENINFQFRVDEDDDTVVLPEGHVPSSQQGDDGQYSYDACGKSGGVTFGLDDIYDDSYVTSRSGDGGSSSRSYQSTSSKSDSQPRQKRKNFSDSKGARKKSSSSSTIATQKKKKDEEEEYLGEYVIAGYYDAGVTEYNIDDMDDT